MHRIDEDTIIILTTSLFHPNEIDRKSSFLLMLRQSTRMSSLRSSIMRKITEEVVNGREKIAIRLKRDKKGHTKLDLALELDLGGMISLESASLTIKHRLREVAKVSMYFQRRVELEDLTDEDGEAIAYDLLYSTHTSKLRVGRLPEVVSKNIALAKLKERHECFEPLLGKFLSGDLGLSKPIHTKLVCVSEKEGVQLGKNGVAAIKSKKLATAGVDGWRVQNKPVDELLEKYPPLEKMFVVLSSEVVKTAPWGLMWRVGIGAFLSLTDMGTDLNVGYRFYVDGEKTYFRCLMGSLGTSIVLQVLLTIIQNCSRRRKEIAKELLFALCGMKSSRDAYKVATGAKQSEGDLMDPLIELVATKCIELFAEGLPAVFIQVAALIQEDDVTSTAIISLVISFLTCGFTAAQISYDFDTDPEARALKPDFYGYIPDSGRERTFLFATMILMSSCLLAARCFGTVMLGTLNMYYVVWYFSLDIGQHVLFKIIRRDFSYWFQISGWANIFFSGMIRIVLKLVTDHTAIVHFRNPIDLGGAQWTLGQLGSILSLVVALHLAEISDNSLISREKLAAMWKICIYLMGSIFFLLVVFFSIINKGYLHTFISIETGWENTVKFFRGERVQMMR